MSTTQRLGLYRKIEIARKQLSEMSDDEFFRDWLEDNFGVRSRKELSVGQLSRLVTMLGTMGATYTSKGSPAKAHPHARADWIEIPSDTPHAAMKRQICTIWRKLGYNLLSLQVRVQREFNVPSILWLKDKKSLTRLLTDLQKREKAFDAKQATGEGTA